uniref:J domain-containing protein n=1 Tax=Diacronema lutheri TaxID=2081491 RepID=A0A7R9YLX9_DIALT
MAAPRYAHLCKCHTTLKEASKALASCAEHKRLDGASSGSRLYMAEAHILNEQFDEATHEYNAIREVDESSKEAREGLQLIDKLKRRALQVDHYKILGVGRSATEREIKRAYHKAAVRYHPDKYVAKNDADAAAADAKFKEIARAYEVLGDEELRRKYDLGEDPDDQQRPGQPRGGGHFRPMHHGGQRVHVHFG